jgi:DNA helicase-2/ATP-dependent DNA helicase PcrA
MADLADLLARMGRCRTAGEALDLLARETDIPAQLEGRKRSALELGQAIAAFDAVHALLKSLAVRPADAAQALAEFDPRAGQGDERCVWVSTIHRAKGKEWRTVFLPRLFEGECPAARQEQPLGTTESPGGIDQSDPLEQERRIFYVGLTRASETVYLEVPELDPSSFIAEIEPPKPAAPAPKRAAAPAKKSAVRPPPGAPNEGKPWSAEDDAALADARAAGATLDELAERFGRSRDAIDTHLVIVESKRRRAEARRRALELDDD